MTVREPLWLNSRRQAAAPPPCGSDGAYLVNPWLPLEATPTAQRAVLPAGWRIYNSPDGLFGCGFPKSWSVVQEPEGGVCLRSHSPAAHLLLLVRPFPGAHRLFSDPAFGLDALTESICGQLEPMQAFEVRQAGPWVGGTRQGHVVEGMLRDDLLGPVMARAYVLVPLSQGEILVAVYSLIDGPSIPPEQHSFIRSIIGLFCLRPCSAWATG